ncbi:MAG TPA: hypothetical protein VHE37_08030 [Nevskiaceae bacterium]|nr:hypothetical protein [Nevskiaceae bacterium]
MNTLAAFDPWLIAAIALITALLVVLALWLAASRTGRRLRRLLDRDWQPVFMQPWHPPKDGSAQ